MHLTQHDTGNAGTKPRREFYTSYSRAKVKLRGTLGLEILVLFKRGKAQQKDRAVRTDEPVHESGLPSAEFPLPGTTSTLIKKASR
jgi:hypothetical protein